MSRRVDDYFPFGCGDTIREKGGRHTARVEAVVSSTVLVRWHETGWRSEYTASGGDWQIEKVPTGRDFLRQHGLPIVEGDPINDWPLR